MMKIKNYLDMKNIKTSTKIIYLIIFLVLIYFLILAFIPKQIDKLFIEINRLLTFIQTVITIIIAYLLYDRFGTSKKIMDIRNQLVVDLLIELKKINFSIGVLDEENHSFTVYNKVFGKRIKTNIPKSILNKKIVFPWENSLSQQQKILEILNNPLFPIELTGIQTLFKSYVLTNASLEYKRENLAFVIINRSFQSDHPTHLEDNSWAYDSNNYELLEFLNCIEDVISEIENWINKKSTISYKLNFE